MSFRMDVTEIFRTAGRTILSGRMADRPEIVRDLPCRLEVDGEAVARFDLAGDVLAGGAPGDRDVWTRSEVQVDPGALASSRVRLVAEG